MASDNTLLVLLGLGGLFLLSKSSSTTANAPAGSGTPQRAGGGGGGSIGGGGAGGGGTSGGGGGTGIAPGSIYSGSNPQPVQPTSYDTDPCNQASPYYDQIACTNEGGVLYYGTPSNPVTTPANAGGGPGASPNDTYDPCDQSSVDYNPDVCDEMNGTVYDSASQEGL